MVRGLGTGNVRHGLQHIFVEAVKLLHLHPLDTHLLDELREDSRVTLNRRPLHFFFFFFPPSSFFKKKKRTKKGGTN